MRLKEITEIKLGTITTRLNKIPYDDFIKYPTISMRQVSSFGSLTDFEYEDFYIEVPNRQLENIILTEMNDIVIGLTSQKSMVIDEENIKKLVPSNFALLKFDGDVIDPFYLCWQFNEGSLSKTIKAEIQGTSTVRVLSIQSILDLNIEMIPIDKQRKIGKIYKSFIKRNNIYNELQKEKYKLIKHGLNKKIGELQNEN